MVAKHTLNDMKQFHNAHNIQITTFEQNKIQDDLIRQIQSLCQTSIH